jgi:diguanylate cyclase (GGDEF)-like protein
MVGDAILIELAKLMKKHLRTSDYMPARLGGDEFALIFSNSSLPDTTSVLDRLCSIVASHHFPIVGAGVLSCSIGLTRQKENDSLESFFNRADKALYNAKETGRNRIFVL